VPAHADRGSGCVCAAGGVDEGELGAWFDRAFRGTRVVFADYALAQGAVVVGSGELNSLLLAVGYGRDVGGRVGFLDGSCGLICATCVIGREGEGYMPFGLLFRNEKKAADGGPSTIEMMLPA
jgi:hypothetical protein